MKPEVMGSAHIPMHHKLHRNGGGFTGFEGHRTDDGGGGSTALLNFHIRLLGEAQNLITHIVHLKRSLDSFPQLNIP